VHESQYVDSCEQGPSTDSVVGCGVEHAATAMKLKA
jgi:hypothetical protein